MMCLSSGAGTGRRFSKCDGWLKSYAKVVTSANMGAVLKED
jgi:hypothetical protein